jgi:hypothetical protein
MEKFSPSTSEQEARALTVGCLQAISAWAMIYMRPSKISSLNGNQSMEPDLDRMVADAADLAARITHATEDRKADNSTKCRHENIVDVTVVKKQCLICGEEFYAFP